MDNQDEGSRRIYITREISRKGGRQFGRRQEVLLVEYQKRRRRIHPRGRTLTLSLTTPLTILFPKDPAQPLMKSSQRPSSQARFSTKFIVLGLLGLDSGSLISTVRDPLESGTLQLALSVGRTWVPMRTIIEQGRAKPPRENNDGQPTGPQMENCREVPSSVGVWHYVCGPRPHQGPNDPRTS